MDIFFIPDETMKVCYGLVLLALVTFFEAAAGESKSHPVTTQLSAKWGITPAELEIAEFIAEENVNLFWDYIDLLNKIPHGLYSIGMNLRISPRSLKKCPSKLSTELCS